MGRLRSRRSAAIPSQQQSGTALAESHQTGHHGVNEVRLRNGRIIRDGFHSTLTEMRLRGRYETARERWFAEHGPGPHFLVCGRDRAKLGRSGDTATRPRAAGYTMARS